VVLQLLSIVASVVVIDASVPPYGHCAGTRMGSCLAGLAERPSKGSICARFTETILEQGLRFGCTIK